MKAALVTAALLLTGVAGVAQDQATAPVKVSRTPLSKPLIVYGKVSDDGKKLLTDIDSEWSVSNSEMLRGFEGLRVHLKCYVDTEQNKLRILYIKKEDGASKFAAARQADSAFRR